MYIKIYVCKMCGAKIKTNIVNALEADSQLLCKDRDKIRHLCITNDIGIAEFAGFQKLDD